MVAGCKVHEGVLLSIDRTRQQDPVKGENGMSTPRDFNLQEVSTLASVSMYVSDDTEVLVFDAGPDAQRENLLYLQVGDHFLELTGRSLRPIADMAVRPAQTQDGLTDIRHRFVINEGTIQYLHPGGASRKVPLGRLRFGVGVGRDRWDDLSFDTEFLGLYRESTEVVDFIVVDYDGDGETEAVVLTSRGRLLVVNREGRILLRRRVPSGRLASARIHPVLHPDGIGCRGLLVSCSYAQRRKAFFWNHHGHDTLTALFVGGKRVALVNELEVLCPAPGDPDRFWGSDDRVVMVGEKRLECAERSQLLGSPIGERDGQLVFDPRSSRKLLLLSSDTAGQQLTLRVPLGEDLWSRELPATEDGSYHLAGSLGRRGPDGEALLALHFSVSRTLSTLKAEVYQSFLQVYRLDGTLVASRSFAETGETPSRGLRLVFGNAQGEHGVDLLVFEGNQIRLFTVDVEARPAENLPPGDSVFAALPAFALPPEDLWSRNLVEGPEEPPPASREGSGTGCAP
jgi:hypothetical protein